ncbi:hypothetical protein [Streptomyces sp. NBC_01483]|uniref:hypothetical protein n=1 Tax=Streptomyces sp. NBC_01483 TaxID=2903883 RepID=UPI002E31D304|nr:hypothetical protein [Streptomyces sp. NBC_01483]
MSEQNEDVRAAKAKLAEAEEELRQQEILESLSKKSGLSYALAGDSVLYGPYLVAWDGSIIGKVRSDTPSVLQDWYAVPNDGEPSGPFRTVRAAAASLHR